VRLGRWWLWGAALALLLVVPRFVDLTADTWPDLCWGSGIWTDEGFYTYNARNAVLFGRAELDQFNNHILSPVLDWIQRLVFARFGAGLTPSRLISVASSFLALGFFWDALRRRFGRRVALYGLLLLGGEASFLFYNRLALMETPACAVLCAALWAWSLATPRGLFAAGVLAASAIAWKTTFLIFLPLPPALALWRGVRGERGALREIGPYTLGAVVGIGLYLALWGVPHGTEILRMNNFYREKQSQPRSFTQLLWMVRRAGIGYHFGLFQRLETRTPVLTTLALAGLALTPWPWRRRECHPRPRRAAEQLLGAWLAVGLLFLIVSRYAPSRYYLVFYPPLAGLAAIVLERLPALLRLARRSVRARRALALTALPLGFHALLPAVWAVGALRPWATFVCLAPAILAVALAWRALGGTGARRDLRPWVLGLFLAISYAQVGAWWGTRSYQTRQMSRHLASVVGPGQVLVGDWGPNLCLENRVRAVPVFRGLANDRDPIRNLRADFILVTQTPYPISVWQGLAPTVARPENLVETLVFHGYRINLYRVPRPVAQGRP
jgi:Dolichyl-phosphate-mannose-protein mannosyltransferase